MIEFTFLFYRKMIFPSRFCLYFFVTNVYDNRLFSAFFDIFAQFLTKKEENEGCSSASLFFDESELTAKLSWIVAMQRELKTLFSWIDNYVVVVVNISNNLACLNEEGGLRTQDGRSTPSPLSAELPQRGRLGLANKEVDNPSVTTWQLPLHKGALGLR